jgi:RNA polymerase sigma-70 factor, ECF subfamily
MLTMDERELVERARQGDRDAFREIVERHKEQVYYLALGLTRDPDDAEDMVQEAFLKAYRSLGRFRGQARLSSWLYRITVNACHDARRRQGAVEAESLDAAAVDEADIRPASDPERSAESDRIRRAVDRAVLGLTSAERSVFVLRHHHELSTRETARVLRRAEGTVKNLLFRALRKLRRELAPYRDLEDAMEEAS